MLTFQVTINVTPLEAEAFEIFLKSFYDLSILNNVKVGELITVNELAGKYLSQDIEHETQRQVVMHLIFT